MLLEVARQFVRDKNGRLLLSRAYMATRGWKSMAMLNKCKAELIEAGFPFQTVQGHRPNKASWYAVTWRALDKHPGYDAGAAHLFIRGAYQNGASLNPPTHGTEILPSVPSHGAIKACLRGSLCTAPRTPSREAIYCTSNDTLKDNHHEIY